MTNIVTVILFIVLILLLLNVLARLAFLAFVFAVSLFDKPQKQGKELEEEIDSLMEAMR